MSKMLRRVIGEDIEMDIQNDPHLGHVQADPTQVEQILMNLVTNARDAMPQGGRLTIATSNVDVEPTQTPTRLDSEIAPGRYVLLKVTDTGKGMDEPTQAHAFEPFFTTKEVGKGTGLGLATVYGIVKQSNGYVEIKSQVGIGTSILIYLPLVENALTQTRDVQKESTILRGQETVLLVEDEELVRRMVTSALQSSGYTVLSASSGEQALSMCKSHAGDISLLVTDVIMPQMNGVQLAQQAVVLRKDLKVIFMSGYTNNILENHGSFDASTPFLTKPVSPRVLAKKVREVLDGHPSKA